MQFCKDMKMQNSDCFDQRMEGEGEVDGGGGEG